MAWIEVQSTGSGNMARGMREVAGLRVRSGCVIGTCKSGFGEEDLCWGKPLDEVHGPLAARTWPGSRPAGQRCIRCRRRLMEQAAAEWEHLSACAVGHPAEVTRAALPAAWASEEHRDHAGPCPAGYG